MGNKKSRVFYLIVTTLVGISLVGCGNTSVKKDGEYLEKGYVSVSGNRYKVPLSVSTLNSNGYTLDTSSLGIDGEITLVSGMYSNGYIPLLKDGEVIGASVRIINNSDETVSIDNTDIYSLRFSDSKNFSLSNGVTVGSSKDDFTRVFGEPIADRVDGSITTVTYKEDDFGIIEVEFVGDTSIVIECILDNCAIRT